MFLPFSVLKPEAAKAVWTVISAISLLLAVYVLFLVFDIPNSNTTGLALFVTAFLFYPAYYNISLGQVYIFMLLLFSLSLYGLRRNNPWLVSIPLGLVLAIKGYGFIPLFMLPFARKWKEAVLTSCVVIVIVLLTLPFIHIQAWSDYYIKIFTTLGRDVYSSSVAYQTVNGFMRHLFFSDPACAAVAVNIADISITVVSILVLGIVAFKRKMESPVNLFTAAITLNIVLAPLAEEYHYVLMLPLIFLLGCTIAPTASGNKITILVFLISLLVLAAPLNYKALQDASFPLILLAYPKLFSAIAILLIFRFTKFLDLEIAGSTTG
jgi:hypothetical protein